MTTREFMKSITKEVALKLQNVKDPQEAYEIAKEAGLTDSFEEFVATGKAMNEEASELLDSEIEAVAGGADDIDGWLFALSTV